MPKKRSVTGCIFGLWLTLSRVTQWSSKIEQTNSLFWGTRVKMSKQRQRCHSSYLFFLSFCRLASALIGGERAAILAAHTDTAHAHKSYQAPLPRLLFHYRFWFCVVFHIGKLMKSQSRQEDKTSRMGWLRQDITPQHTTHWDVIMRRS